MKIVNHVVAQGSGIPVVLVHAFPVDHRMWLECARQLTEQAQADGLEPFPIYAPDTPGAGVSPVPSEGETGGADQDGAYPQALDRMADSYAQLLTDLGHTRAIWVGLSMGGYLVTAIQRLYPQMVAGFALCDTTTAADKPESRANRLCIARECESTGSVDSVMHFAQAGPQDSTVKRSAECVATFTNWIESQSPEGIAWRQRMAAGRPDQSKVLDSVRVPSAVISGELDPSSPPEAMRPIVDALQASRPEFTRIADCGHFSAVEHPSQVASALLALVNRVGQAALTVER
ncbi:alpha/beta hydrolase [Bombiscardovia apis]|nr:alpha/beta hydrolase [Bombiscardovia apis]